MVTDFLVDNFVNISHDVILPLAKVYSRSEVFGRRLEILLYDRLAPAQRLFISHTQLEEAKDEVNQELKDLRRIMGKNLWSIHFEELRDSMV